MNSIPSVKELQKIYETVLDKCKEEFLSKKDYICVLLPYLYPILYDSAKKEYEVVSWGFAYFKPFETKPDDDAHFTNIYPPYDVDVALPIEYSILKMCWINEDSVSDNYLTIFGSGSSQPKYSDLLKYYTLLLRYNFTPELSESNVVVLTTAALEYIKHFIEDVHHVYESETQLSHDIKGLSEKICLSLRNYFLEYSILLSIYNCCICDNTGMSLTEKKDLFTNLKENIIVKKTIIPKALQADHIRKWSSQENEDYGILKRLYNNDYLTYVDIGQIYNDSTTSAESDILSQNLFLATFKKELEKLKNDCGSPPVLANCLLFASNYKEYTLLKEKKEREIAIIKNMQEYHYIDPKNSVVSTASVSTAPGSTAPGSVAPVSTAPGLVASASGSAAVSSASSAPASPASGLTAGPVPTARLGAAPVAAPASTLSDNEYIYEINSLDVFNGTQVNTSADIENKLKNLQIKGGASRSPKKETISLCVPKTRNLKSPKQKRKSNNPRIKLIVT